MYCNHRKDEPHNDRCALKRAKRMLRERLHREAHADRHEASEVAVSRAAKAKGTRWESDVVRFLNSAAVAEEAERLVQTGVKDQGDVRVGPFILQCKDRAQIDLSGSVDDGHTQLLSYQRGHPGTHARYSAAVIKHRRRGVGEGYVVLTLADFTRLLGELS